MNTAIAGAQDPVAMAEAMKLAVRAGRLAFLVGPHPAQAVREREQPGRRPGRPLIADAEEPDDLAALEGGTRGRRPRIQRRADAARSRDSAAAGRFPAPAAGSRRAPGHAAQHALEDRRRRAAGGFRRGFVAAVRRAVAPLFEQQQAFNSAVVDHINRNVRSRARRREAMASDADRPARHDRRS